MNDLSTIIGFAALRGRALLAFYGLGTLVVALLNLDGVLVTASSVIALVLLIAALALLSLPSGEPFERRLTIAVVGLVEVITILMAWNIRTPADPGYAAWHQGAVTFVLLVLLLRGRRAVAWYAFAGFTAISIAAAVTENASVVGAANACVRQAGTLLIATLFAIVLRRAARAIASITSTQLTRETRDAATATALRERAVQNARLERDARPALRRLTSEQPLTDQELRAIALLTEALRDGITAAGFAGAQLASDIRFARNRGIRVVLVDDRGTELDPHDQDRVEFALIQEIRMCRFGSVTARLSPADGAEIATIIVDEGGSYRSIVVGHHTVDVTRIA